MKMKDPEFAEHYARVLDMAQNDGVFTRLITRGIHEDIVLMCWEHEPERCHRGKVASYVKTAYGEDWPEHPGMKPKKAPAPKQEEMFGDEVRQQSDLDALTR